MRVKILIDPIKLKNHHVVAVNILRGRISIFSLPRKTRIMETTYYIYCFRFLKKINNQPMYATILDLLKDDIGYIMESCKKSFFEDLYNSEVNNYVSIYQQEKTWVLNFRCNSQGT